MPIRDLLITAIVLGAIPYILRHAYVGVLMWTWLSVMNPHRLTWGFAYDAPFAALVGGATLIALLITKDPIRLPKSSTMNILIVFVVWMCVTTIFAVYPGDSLPQLDKVLRIQLMTFVALAVLHERKYILIFVAINVLSLAFFGVKGGIYTIQTAGSGMVWGAGGFIRGNNEIGLAILMAIPFLYYLRLINDNKWVRRALLVAMLLCAIAVLGTQSRGAFLAIGVMSFVLWLRSPHKFVFGVGGVLTVVALVAFMPWSLDERIRSITEYEQDSSAVGRLNAWQTAINVANDRPTGAGFDMYNRLVFALYAPQFDSDRGSDPSIVRAAHSIYFQILGEHGWVGLVLYLVFWLYVWRDALKLRQMTRRSPEYEWIYHLAGMAQVSLVGFAVGGAFLSLAYWDVPFNIMVMLVVAQRWLANDLKRKESVQASGPIPQTAVLAGVGAHEAKR